MDSIRALGETLLQKFLRVIGLGADYTGCIDKLVQTNLEISRRKNVVGVRSKAKTASKKLLDPKSGACPHSRKMCMSMSNAHSSQACPDINGLIKTEKVGAPPPLI